MDLPQDRTVQPPTVTALRDLMRADLAPYAQFDGQADRYVPVIVGRDWVTKGGVGFKKGDLALAAPRQGALVPTALTIPWLSREPEARTVYSWRRRCHCSVGRYTLSDPTCYDLAQAGGRAAQVGDQVRPARPILASHERVGLLTEVYDTRNCRVDWGNVEKCEDLGALVLVAESDAPTPEPFIRGRLAQQPVGDILVLGAAIVARSDCLSSGRPMAPWYLVSRADSGAPVGEGDAAMAARLVARLEAEAAQP